MALAAAGMDDLRGPHMAVFQYPGPHGTSPLELARQTQMSKQAMNQLLGTLERIGYIVRKRDPDNGKQRVVHLTARGERAIALMREEVTRIERAAERRLGARRYATMLECLRELAGGEPGLTRTARPTIPQSPRRRSRYRGTNRLAPSRDR
jgi:DNA-binding MarR family transcriptional regulator